MRAWGLNQPHADMVIRGVKRIETRPAPCGTLVGKRIVIHANLTHKWAAMHAAWPFNEHDLSRVAYGALIGTVVVKQMWPMSASYAEGMARLNRREHALGDYAEGRWGFALAEPRPFPTPVPWKGKQGVFMLPDDLVTRAELGCYECGMPHGTVLGPRTEHADECGEATRRLLRALGAPA